MPWGIIVFVLVGALAAAVIGATVRSNDAAIRKAAVAEAPAAMSPR